MSEQSEARMKLAERIAQVHELEATRDKHVAQTQALSAQVRELQAELADLEAQADAAARSAVVGGESLRVDDLEAKIASVRRRSAAASTMAEEAAGRVRSVQAGISELHNRARREALAVVEEEGHRIGTRFETIAREFRALFWQLQTLHGFLIEAKEQDAAIRIIRRLRRGDAIDKFERWPVGRLSLEWQQFVDALVGDAEAPAPEFHP